MSSEQNILVKLNKAGFSLNNKWLVKGVSLQVEKGKIVTLIGPNGSGKSTTAKIALGIYKKIDGSVEKYTNKVGYVPQKISIDWTLPLRVNDFMVLTESLNKESIDEALSLTGSIEVNSVILEAQKKKIRNVEDLNQALKQVLNSNQKTILLVIYNSQNQKRYIGVKLD